MNIAAGSLPMSRRLALWKFLWVGLTSFGSGKWTYLHVAFVRNGSIPEDVFLRDFAMAQVLPGASFVSLTVLCGLRLGGAPMAFAGLCLVTIPGALLMIAAMVFVSGTDPRIAGALHGILVGAVALLLVSFVRLSRSARTAFDIALATATLLLTIAGVPLIVTILIVGGVGVWRHRRAEPAT